MTWAAQDKPQQTWSPQPSDATLAVANAVYVVPYVQNDDVQFVVELKPNVVGGREPYQFELDDDADLPPETILERETGRLIFPVRQIGLPNAIYSSTILVNDANEQQTSFRFATSYAGGPVTIETDPPMDHGKFPDAHGEYVLDFIVRGGIPPITLVFIGLDLAAMGFVFDGTVDDEGKGQLKGENVTGVDWLANVVLIQAYNSGNDPSGGDADGELVATWDIYAV